MKPYMSMVTLGVDSIQRSREFYEGVLGLPIKVASAGFVAYELNNLVLGLYPRDALAKDIGIQDTGKGFSAETGNRWKPGNRGQPPISGFSWDAEDRAAEEPR